MTLSSNKNTMMMKDRVYELEGLLAAEVTASLILEEEAASLQMRLGSKNY